MCVYIYIYICIFFLSVLNVASLVIASKAYFNWPLYLPHKTTTQTFCPAKTCAFILRQASDRILRVHAHGFLARRVYTSKRVTGLSSFSDLSFRGQSDVPPYRGVHVSLCPHTTVPSPLTNQRVHVLLSLIHI